MPNENVIKEKTNLYLNKYLKIKAKEKLNKYGMNLSSFVNLMLAKFIDEDIDMLLPRETIAVIEDFEHERKTFEKPITLEGFKRDIS